MGIKNLNRYLKRNCNKGLEYLTIDKLQGKTIVIDTSIYMYKYLEENALLENFFVLITHFRSYHITPLFIFDGKADASKMNLLWKRVMKKKEALKEYEKLKTTVDTVKECDRKQILEKMEMCRKNSTRVREDDVVLLKKLFDAMGVFYYTAPMEADIVCAYIVKKGFAWACMSDDMDLFVYGCNRVLREWNVHKNSGILYHRDQIIKEVRVEPGYFSHILLLLGSDYHQDICKHEVIHIDTAFKWYDEFMKNVILMTIVPGTNRFSFYDWLLGTRKISPENREKLETIEKMYQIPDDVMDVTMHLSSTPNINWSELQKLMAPYGFVI
jgi:5'-3' exonuclease